MVDYIVFDLDGTLLDTLIGLTLALNNTLKELNESYRYKENEVKGFIGNGAFILLSRALKRTPSDDEFSLFLKHYEEDQYVSVAFPKVNEVLKELKEKGIKLIIYSNKPDEILQKLVKRNLNEVTFDYIQGQDKAYPPKPDVTLLNRIIHKLNLENKKGLFVGDSIVDVLTARNVNLDSLILTYGYGKEEDFKKDNSIKLINTFEEVKEYI